jgi:hypothetical protein
MMQADLALYGAKDEGRNCYRFHSPDLDQQVRERVRVADELTLRWSRGISNFTTSRRSSPHRAASPGWRP